MGCIPGSTRALTPLHSLPPSDTVTERRNRAIPLTRGVSHSHRSRGRGGGRPGRGAGDAGGRLAGRTVRGAEPCTTQPLPAVNITCARKSAAPGGVRLRRKSSGDARDVPEAPGACGRGRGDRVVGVRGCANPSGGAHRARARPCVSAKPRHSYEKIKRSDVSKARSVGRRALRSPGAELSD